MREVFDMTHPTDDELEAMAVRLDRKTPNMIEGHAQMEDAADKLRACKGGAVVRLLPLEWVEVENYWEAKTPVGTYRVGFDDGWWAECDGPSMWEWDATEDARYADGPSAAIIACKADCERRILSALEPAPDARQEGWRAGIEAVAKVADRRAEVCDDAWEKTKDHSEKCAAIEARHIARKARALAEKGPTHD